MEWRVKIHRKALRFIESLPGHERKRVQAKIKELVESLEKGSLPFRSLDIKKLKGGWEGFLRIRVGNVRIIFRIDIDRREVIIYHAHYRGKVYK